MTLKSVIQKVVVELHGGTLANADKSDGSVADTAASVALEGERCSPRFIHIS